MTISSQLRQRIRDVAGELRRELYGEQGCPEWGTKFTEMENAACEIGDAVTCELLQQALQRQADDAPIADDGRARRGRGALPRDATAAASSVERTRARALALARRIRTEIRSRIDSVRARCYAAMR